jgi:N-acetylglucosamine-6-phosphate deacetylase
VGGSGLAVPGLVDLQVNGVGAHDFRSCGPEGYRAASMLLAAGGATAVQPTFHSQDVGGYERSLRVLDEVAAGSPPGCTFLPAHLEGPFLSTSWAGAHDPRHLCDPDPQLLDRLLAAGPVGFVTLAPELPGALDTIESLAGRGVVVSVGHTDADAAGVRAAMTAGARHLSHCWNAHRRLTARDPGPAGVALASADLVVGLVGDLAHVAAEVVQLTLRAAPGRVAVTTDSVALPAGESAAVDDRDGARPVVRRLADGTIAGGLSRPADCLRNLVAIGTDLPAAVDACGGVQRRLLGLPDVRLLPREPGGPGGARRRARAGAHPGRGDRALARLIRSPA